MTTRARNSAALLAIGLMVAACRAEQGAAGAPAEVDAVTPVAIESCLTDVYRDRPARDEAFDRAHDAMPGGSLSCGLSITASELRDTLAQLREAAAAEDRKRLLGHVGIPMVYIDAQGTVRQLPSMTDIEAFYDDIFTTAVVRRLATLRLEDASVVPGEGLFFDLGAVWLIVADESGRPQLLTVNHQAAEEAAAAAALEAVQEDSP